MKRYKGIKNRNINCYDYDGYYITLIIIFVYRQDLKGIEYVK